MTTITVLFLAIVFFFAGHLAREKDERFLMILCFATSLALFWDYLTAIMS